jgi:23S rRNA pseudouridine2605 synthase
MDSRRVKRRRSLAAPSPKAASSSSPQQIRLQKVLAAAGIGSRRQCEELITAGRVEVDRRVVTELGTRVDPARQAIRVDGVALPTARHEYFAVNKPSGVLSTNRDPSGRTRVVDLVESKAARLFTIGRLDLHSDGLILVTNDGELANRLTHPRYGVSKTYRVVVAGSPTREVLAKLEQGVHLAEGIARVERVAVKSHHKESTTLEMVLREGKNREIRRVLARVGHKVLRLTRIAVGPVRLGSLPAGAARRLTPEEIKMLRREGRGAREQP